ncbi:zinc-finger of the MIZ type in Nse subunit-domain-containing protein [Xylariales sp. AK1849]|nr:zinc-finger of the MIZ type in Nse subunit-domain-containing protein [Xylariales sp. AK1849]
MSNRRLLSHAHGGRPRGRPSTTASNPTPSSKGRRHRSPIELPDYEPPSCPLDSSARTALSELSNVASTRKYSEQLSHSLKLLGATVAEINDRYVDRKASLKHLQDKRREKDGDVEKSDHEKALEVAVGMLREKVPGVTEKSEKAVREVIDWNVEVMDGRQALEEARQMVEEESGRAGGAGARGVRRRRRNEEEESKGGEDDDMGDPEDDIEVTGALRYHATAKEKMATDWASQSLYRRYGLNNDYVQFKKLWHDAVHGNEGKPLPNPERWFNENGEEGVDDEDEDLIIAEEVIDLKCPLSLIVMTEPYTSDKCKHTFEKTAISEFLNSKPGRKAQCPQTGCNKELSMKDFHLDEVMLRRIKRAQDKNNDDDDEDDAEGDTSMRVTSQRHIKAEREHRGRRRQVEEIEDEEDKEEEEDEEDEEENEEMEEEGED